MASTSTVTISRAPNTPCLHGRFCNRSPSSFSLGNLSQQNRSLTWNINKSKAKRSLRVYGLFGGKKENNDKADDSSSKFCSENCSFGTRNSQMACASPNLISIHGSRQFVFPAQFNQKDSLLQLQSRRRRFQSISCLSNSDSSTTENKPLEPVATNDEADQVQASASSDNAGLPEFPNKDVNRRIALISSIGAAGLFVTTRLDFGVSLKDLSASALPYEEALSNGKPTVVEFYADWCEVCRELARDIYGVEQKYRDRVNFVMLNVDNTNWEQELDEFGVEGIPHFAFLDKDGNEEGNVVGRLPKQYFLDNVDALARGEASIPHARVVGQYSSAESRKVHQVVDPRSHG